MLRNKLTPCRRVGLSRKKNTPLKTVENLLQENVSVDESKTPEITKKSKEPKPIVKTDVNINTPCRHVGLSRKRKVSLGNSQNRRNSLTKSVDQGNSIKNQIDDTSVEISSICTSDNEESKHSKVSKIPGTNGDLQATSAKNLSNILPSVINNKVKQDEVNVQTNERNETTERKKRKVSKEKSLPLSIKTSDNNINLCDDVSKSPRDNNDLQVTCAKKLLNIFPPMVHKKAKQDDVEVQLGEAYTGENNTIHRSHIKVSKEKSITKVENIKSIEEDDNSSDCSLSSLTSEIVNKCQMPNNLFLHQGELYDKNSDMDPSSKKHSENTNDLTVSSHSQNQFIKVCYSNDDIDANKSMKQTSLKDEKKQKFSYVLLEDDDDFEIGQKKKKMKKIERSRTDNGSKHKKTHKNIFKKSLSVGDKRSRTLTDSSIISNASSLELMSDCFVKLEKIKEPIPKLDIKLLTEEHSDDDFEVSSHILKENKIRNLDDLEKEVDVKRKILEELERAKMYKKIHSTEDLKNLTSKWKTGCIDALQDLLKQLNMHSYMEMAMLLKKLNIPDDFIPPSQ